jgi:hypothetical protein
MCLAFKKGLSRSLQERSLDIGRALESDTLVQSWLEDCRANVEQFNRQWFERSIKTARHRGYKKPRICGRQIMRDNVQDYFRKSITTFSRLYAEWNENKVYQPSHQNRFGAAIGSIYYWKYCPITEPPPVKWVSGSAPVVSSFCDSKTSDWRRKRRRYNWLSRLKKERIN